MQLAPETAPAIADLLEIPSLARAIGSGPQPHVDRKSLTPVTFALAAACVVAGVTIGTLIGFSGPSTITAAAPVVHAAMPVVTPAPTPVVAAAPAPPPTTLRVESTPPGATVMFIANNATTLVGTTPIETNVDPTHAYDVLVTLANHASRIEHLEPSSNHHLVIALAPTR